MKKLSEESELQMIRRLMGQSERAVEKMVTLSVSFMMNENASSTTIRSIFELEQSVHTCTEKIEDRVFLLLENSTLSAQSIFTLFHVIKFSAGLERLADYVVSMIQAPFFGEASGVDEYNSQIQVMIENLFENLRSGLECLSNPDRQEMNLDALARQNIMTRAAEQIRMVVTTKVKAEKMPFEVSVNLLMLSSSLERLGSHAFSMVRMIQAPRKQS